MKTLTLLFLPFIAIGAEVQTFTTPGAFTWTKPSGAISVTVQMIGAGGGGGSGRCGDAGTVRCGGGGGGAAACVTYTFNAALLSDQVVGNVGLGGAGGAGQINNADGSLGTTGSNSTFAWLVARGGGAGFGGTAANGFGGAAAVSSADGISYAQIGNGQAANPTGGGIGGKSFDITLNASGGACGGGITVGNVAGTGPNAGRTGYMLRVNAINGGIPGQPHGESVPVGEFGGGGGGKGGDASTSGNAANGGNGGNYGAGGGGGGAATFGVGSSGAGGRGGDGIVIVTSY